ncbi:membrane protein insertase YidC [Kaarinaea lacus]
MDNQRLILFVALSIVIMLLFSAWQEQFGPQPTPSTDTAPAVTTAPGAPAQTTVTPPVASGQQQGAVPPSPQSPTASAPAAAKPMASGERIRVVTDVFDIEIDTVGGDIRRAALLQYPEKADTPEQPVQLFNDTLPREFIAQSGLAASAGPTIGHNVIFTAEQNKFQLAPGENTLEVVLTATAVDGVQVRKIYRFNRNDYAIDVNIEINNNSDSQWSGRWYRQLQRTQVSKSSAFIYTYTGGVVSTPNNVYEKVEFDDMQNWKPEESYSKGGWAAMIQHYFLGAWIPSQDVFSNYYTQVVGGDRFRIGVQSADFNVAVGETKQLSSKLYIGPKQQKILAEIAPNLELTVDYGILTILSKPLYWLLDKIHSWVGNWGWSIIFVTLIIKAVFYKLSEASYRSMANLRKFQPKMQAIRERYGNDRQRMSQAMMDIYKKEKINPLGGCLPMLVQIPVFIALYWVLLETVELRQADFILWIDDLSSKDPYYVLPVIMGVSMFVQQKLNPAPMDPVQQKVMMALPWIFTLFFAFFPSGLVLYWVANNILSITQQWYITRKIEAQSSKA